MEEPQKTTYPLEATVEAWEKGEVTQKEISDRTGFSLPAVCRLFKGRGGYSYRRAVKCFEALQAIRAERAANQNNGENK